MELVIYGINDDTLNVINSVRNTNHIVAISDGLRNVDYMYGYPFCTPPKLNAISFDYIIVCVREKKTYEIILEHIISCGVPGDVVLSFHNLFYESRVDQVMLQAKNEGIVFDGLIMGISHAAYAINPEYMDGHWANVAVPSEDIMNHNYVIDKIMVEYAEQVGNLDKVIIDLYDYSVLNFVTKYSRYSVEFYDLYCGDGIEYQKNFEEIEMEILNRKFYSSKYARDNRALRKKIFDDELVFQKYHNRIFPAPTPIDFFYKECVYNDYELDSLSEGFSFIPAIQRDNNISINIEQLSMLVDKIYKINKEMRVYFVLIPRIAEAEKKINSRLEKYKKTLYEEVGKLLVKYPTIKFLDYKGVNEISLYTKGYCSVAHMNTKGQFLFTKKLNREIIKGER